MKSVTDICVEQANVDVWAELKILSILKVLLPAAAAGFQTWHGFCRPRSPAVSHLWLVNAMPRKSSMLQNP